MTLTEVQKEQLKELNKQAKELHPHVNDTIINLVNTYYVLHGEDEQLSSEEIEFRRNMYEKTQNVYETKIISNNDNKDEISPAKKTIQPILT